jgi:hypothetical protein
VKIIEGYRAHTTRSGQVGKEDCQLEVFPWFHSHFGIHLANRLLDVSGERVSPHENWR